MIEVKNSLNGELNASIVKEYPELEEITVIPTLDGQELEPSKYGYSKITVKAIPATDITLSPSEEEQNLIGIFKEVNINPIQVEEITTDLDFSSSNAIELTAQEGAYIKKATINKDANLTPENIKSGVSILGISGDVADTSDADATSNDIIAGKTAYVANEKIAGTYIPLDTSDATATAEDIAKDKTAYVNGEKVVGNMSVFDTSQIRKCNYMFENNKTMTECRGLDTSNVTSTDYMFYNCNALEIVDLDTSNVTSAICMFESCYSLKSAYGLTTTKLTNMNRMFYGCVALTDVPIFDMSSVKLHQCKYTFTSCNNLTDESLNNILASCITATNMTNASAKKLSYMGITNSKYIDIIPTLSNYQAFLDAGWTIE